MRRIMTITLLLILFALICKAPERRVLYIELPTEIQPYESLIKAVTWVESKHGLHIWNPIEEAVGWFQIRQVRVEDYNKRTGSNYKLEDFYDYELSRQMFLYFARGKTFEQAAKNWNGSGPKTITYWRSVQAVL